MTLHSAAAREARMPGVELLRDRRGRQTCTFGDIADHLLDYGRMNPAAAAALDSFAEFLARVEKARHTHTGNGSRFIWR
jgi:hypothetical protein